MNLGMPEMIFIFLLALVLFGPKKLPELGRQLGKFLAEFKKASNQFKNQIEVETTGVPPFESVPRAPLASLTEGQPVEAPESQPLVVDLQPQVPNLTSVAPTRNA
jgi:TatA/E family protein of Tat protein translocase